MHHEHLGRLIVGRGDAHMWMFVSSPFGDLEEGRFKRATCTAPVSIARTGLIRRVFEGAHTIG